VEDNPGEVGNPNPQSIYAGVELAAAQFQEHAGINVVVVPYADGGDVETAKEMAEQIAKSGAVAVIGHSAIETSRAAAEIYDAEGIPVLNSVPVTETLTDEHPYYFNTSYTSETEAAYLANYLRKIKGAETASVISTDDGYGQLLANQFGNTFTGLGGTITIESVISGSNDLELDAVISQIISADTETQNPGTIFLATDDITAAQLIIKMKQKGVSYPVVGASNLSTTVFQNLINEQSEEKVFPGYYTEGILTTHAIIFDSANRYASRFRQDYQTKYQADPSDRAVNGYDAALLLFKAFLNSDIDGSGVSIGADRQKLYRALLNIDDTDSAVQGVVSSIYFEPSRNIVRAPRFGIYQSGRIVSANTQFEPIAAPNLIRNIEEQTANGRIITVDGRYVYKANVIYAGIDLLGIEEIDIKTSTYNVDFYLWFRYRPNDLDEEFQPDDFVFTNAEGDPESILIREQENADGTYLKTYRVSGIFKNQFQFYDYPFDHQTLAVEFRNQNATTSYIQYVVDQIGMRYEEDHELLTNFQENGAFESIYGWDEREVIVAQDVFPTFTTFGSPQNFDRKVATNYSLINLVVDVQRSSLQYIVKSLLPLLITLILAYITFFLPLGHSERMAVGSTALLTTAFFHLTLADSLPEIGYTVAMEYLFYASYVMSALIVLLETLSIRYETLADGTRKKSEKAHYNAQRQRLNMIGRLVYPTIMSIVLVAGYFVHNGSLHLGPREAEVDHLVDLIGRTAIMETQNVDTDQASFPEGSVINLKLNTWRPEDDQQIQILLDEFQSYAKETYGKDIVIEHRPVVSVNYDSILDIELSGEGGPDLFYVRPFSVDGSIARYLLPLNDMKAIDENYDETKITPWEDRTGTYYAVPFAGVVQGVYYNKDLFDEYGLSVPKTWGEFLVLLGEIAAQDPEMIPIANALNDSEDSEMFMSIAANFLGGPEGRALLMRTDGTGFCFDNSRVTSAFRAIEYLKPYLPEEAGMINSQQSKELFFNKQAVMLFGGSWDLQKVSNEADFNWDVFAVPAPATRQTYVIFQPDIGIGINKNSQYQEEAQQFLEWLTTKQAVNLVAKNLKGFYPLNEIKPDEAGSAEDEKFLNLAHDYAPDIRWMFVEISNQVPRADKIIIKSLNEIVSSDEFTAEEAARNLQSGLGEWYEPAQSCQR
jgi:branched-chain amino acid transport system substrate-binding protein